MAATIKYKGSTIAMLDTDATKVLKVGGKYCEGDITVENMRDSEHGYKEWTVTISEKVTSGKVVFATDSDIAAHYADDTAIGAFMYSGDIDTLVYHDLVGNDVFNRPIYRVQNSAGTTAVYYGNEYYMSSSGTVGAGLAIPLRYAQNSAVIQANSTGELYIYASATRMIPAGDYRVSFWW